ncbi:MAG: class I SAM-dependent methyltransferase [bacterium]|nr:class I SAM-dependent methyltransferase [bacterium]
MSKKIKYTFGSSKAAAERLEEIAAFFNPLAKEFICSYIINPVETAIDSGCGPGYTTAMFADATKSTKTYGFDKSQDFLCMAKEKYPDYFFLNQDITKTPFPIKTDVMYSRFLLSHLANAVDIVNLWISQLKPNGLLFIDELEDIETDIDVFKAYLNVSKNMIKTAGAKLYAGNILAKGEYKANILCNRCDVIPVKNNLAATWFLPNTLTVWNDDEYVKANINDKDRKFISCELMKLKELQANDSNITWKMRRIVLKNE